MRINIENKYFQNIYFFLLCVLVMAIPLSNFFMSAAQILLCANWLLEGRFKEKFSSKSNNIILFSILGLFFIHLLWMINSENIAYGLDDIRKKLPLLSLPLVLLTSASLDKKQVRIILICYCCAVLGGSFFGFGRFLLYGDSINYREIIPFISHIRFSLNVCLVIFILIYGIINNQPNLSLKHKIISAITVLWLLYFLGLLHSYTGIIIVITISIILLLQHFIQNRNFAIKCCIISAIFLIFITIGYITYYYINQYYTLSPLSTNPQKELTNKGNKYSEKDTLLIENGNYVYSYVCEKELKEEWRKKSTIAYDSVDNAKQPIKFTIIRYLNSKGLTKDAEGISKLNRTDINRIEQGVANIVYEEGTILHKMIYVLLLEREHYKKYNCSYGHSVYQRFELWETSFQIIKQHLFFGVGTGDVADVIKNQLQKNDSLLSKSSLRTHNQYITFILSFGIIGFILVLYTLLYAPIKMKAFSENYFFLIFFIIAAISMISEDTLETEAGVTFFAFFYSFFLIRKKS